MIKKLLSLCFMLCAFLSYSQETYVPDDNFEAYLETHDANGNIVLIGAATSMGNGIDGDNYVTTEKIESVTNLRVISLGIADLTGIEGFTALKELRCSSNSLTTIDITQNIQLTHLYCAQNQLTNLDVTQNTALILLSCYDNPLGSLDVTQNLVLENLDCVNNDLTSLDVSQNNALLELDCYDNQLTSLDFTQNILLEELYCNDNVLTSLNLKNGNNINLYVETDNNPNLNCILVDNASATILNSWYKDTHAFYSTDCRQTNVPDAIFEDYLETHNANGDIVALGDPSSMGNGVANDNAVTTEKIESVTDLRVVSLGITDLTGIEDFLALESLSFTRNLLTNIDLSQNTELTYLWCGSNNLTSLDLTKNTKLIELSCFSNPLGSLDVTQNILLEELNCATNQLTSLDLTQNSALIELSCEDNEINSLDLPINTALKFLYCNNNQLSSLDVTQSILLEELECHDNVLTSLDVSKNTVLDYLYFDSNQLTSIDVTQNIALVGIRSQDNALTSLDLSKNIALRRLECQDNALTSLDLRNGNNANTRITATNNPNLYCIQVDDPFVPFSFSSIDAIASFNTDCGTHVPDDNFETYLETHNSTGGLVTIGDITSMGNGIANDNYVETERIKNVTSLDVTNLGILDLTGIEDFIALKSLTSIGNSLTEIDVTKNVALTNLDLYRNALTSIDISQNVQLTSLVVADNQLTSLDISQNIKLDYLDCNINPLTNLDVTQNTLLTILYCDENELASIDVSKNLILERLSVRFNQLTTLDVTQNIALEELEFTDNELVSIDLSQNLALLVLYIEENQLTTLDLSKNVALEILVAYNNQLTTLDLSKNVALETLEAYDNQLTYLTLKNGNNASTFSYVKVTNNPDLSCIEVDDASAATSGTGNYSRWDKDATASYNEDCTAPVITLTGDNPQTIELGDGYTELGATTDDGSNVIIDISDFVDAVGSYTILYNATDASNNAAVEVTRTVNVVDTTAPVITLLGDNPQTIELGSGYTELGATTDDGSNVIIDISDFVDAVGSYTILYNATDASNNAAVEVTRTVNIVDTTAPVITLLGDNPQTIELGSGYTELGATTDDGSNVMIETSDFVDAVGSYTILYNATDASNNATVEVTRTVNVVDTTAPVITLLGDNPQTIELGDGYTELGATTDDGSNVIIEISDFVDAVGSYTILYNATDASNNAALEVTRTVNVVDTTAPIITLVGDNPQVIELGSGYTELGATTDDGSNLIIETSGFTDAVGSYTILYNATDASNNAAVEVTRTVNVIDTTAPVITLLGDNPQTIELGSGYTELGATTDDGSNVVIDISDFTDAIGSYTILYNATDASSNTAVEVTRTVNVVPVLGIEDTILNEVQIYPNPMKEWFMISGLIQKVDVELFNINGQRVMVISEYVSGKISADRIEAGVYFARITSENVVKTVRLIKT